MFLSKIKTLFPAPKDGVSYEILPSVSCIRADADGNILTGVIKVSAYKTEGTERTACSMGALAVQVQGGGEEGYRVQYKIDNTSWTDCRVNFVGGSGGASQYVYGVPGSAVSTVTVGIAFRLLYGTSSSYTVLHETAALQVVRNGQTGQRGKAGRFYYYGGYFDNTKEYTATDNQAPYVAFDWEDTVTVNGVSTQVMRTSYYMLVAETNKPGNTYIAPRTSAASGVWELMENSFKWLITEAFFTLFAKLGSAVFCGDWMLSQHGTINGVGSTQYQKFDPAYPDRSENTTHTVNGETWSGYNFVPNYAVDLLKGKTYMQDAVVYGTVKTKSFQIEFADIRSLADHSLFVVGVDTVINGNDITGIWNFKSGYHTVVLPTNKYAHYGQRVIIYNPTIGLGGANGTTIICGELDLDGELPPTPGILRGVGLNNNNSNEPIQLNAYTPVKSIEFLNGTVELMCVPTDDQNLLCEWCVMNIGTNVYKMTS